MNRRIRAALEFLKEGKCFRVGDIRLGIDETGDIEAAGWSQFSNLESLSKEICVRELNELKALFNRIVEDSPELRKFIQGKTVVYCLYFDDYGKASIPICSEKFGIVKWFF